MHSQEISWRLGSAYLPFSLSQRCVGFLLHLRVLLMTAYWEGEYCLLFATVWLDTKSLANCGSQSGWEKIQRFNFLYSPCPVNPSQPLPFAFLSSPLSFQVRRASQFTWTVFSKWKVLSIKESFYSFFCNWSLFFQLWNWLRSLRLSRNHYSQPCDYFYKGGIKTMGGNGWLPTENILSLLHFLSTHGGRGRELENGQETGLCETKSIIS